MTLRFWLFRRRREPVVRFNDRSDAQLAATITRLIRTGELNIKDMS